MTKKQREQIFNKYGGRCAYCGCELQKGWHVDEVEPVRRRWRYEYKLGMRTGKKLPDGYDHPERLHVDNQNPACASCNINKHSMSLEEFRSLIKGFMNHLNNVNTQYKIAKRYGLVSENDIDIKFYFEIYKL